MTKPAMLNVKALAMAMGVLWGAAVMFLGWAAMYGLGNAWIALLSSTYLGYEASFLGGIIGGFWGFIDGAIGGAILAWLYNYFGRK